MITHNEIEAKVKNLDALLDICQKLKAQGKSIVTNNGSYDIMHLGHINGLFYAAQQGDVLIVGLNSDQSIKSYKSIHRPINDQYMRLRMLAALSCVDFVFLFDETIPNAWLEQIKPDVHTNGAEYGDDCIEKEVVEANGGRLCLLPMTEGYKTSLIVEKIHRSK